MPPSMIVTLRTLATMPEHLEKPASFQVFSKGTASIDI